MISLTLRLYAAANVAYNRLPSTMFGCWTSKTVGGGWQIRCCTQAFELRRCSRWRHLSPHPATAFWRSCLSPRVIGGLPLALTSWSSMLAMATATLSPCRQVRHRPFTAAHISRSIGTEPASSFPANSFGLEPYKLFRFAAFRKPGFGSAFWKTMAFSGKRACAC